MRKLIGDIEDGVFFYAAILSLVAIVAALILRVHHPFQNDRVQYGMERLPAALAAVFLFIVLVGIARVLLVRSRRLSEYPAWIYIVVLVLAYCIFWLPIFLTGGFVQDDWMLLAAASIRKIIYLHPGYSWYALDSVDGNFRPLGTVLYIAYMLKWFGLSAQAFLAGNFLLTLLSSLVAFFIVRELGYSKLTGAAASLLYMSRGVLYTVVSWVSALSDGISILFCALMALAILKANKRDGLTTIAFHLGAWLAFCVATLGKQSSFVAPLIVALLLFLRPGEDRMIPVAQRMTHAVAGLLIYAATAAIPFFHAKALLQTTSPYPFDLSPGSVLRLFSYAIWYVTTFYIPPSSLHLQWLPEVAGMATVAAALLLIWKFPRLLGGRPRDVLFAALASVASISLFIVLSSRLAPYYGTMAAFWMSIALGIALTRLGPPQPGDTGARIASFAFCVLFVTGFADIRLRQTALVPAGGYTWGTYGMDRERSDAAGLRKQLAAAPEKEMLILIDFPDLPSYYGSMAMIFDPHLQRILSYDRQNSTFLANDHGGLRPGDDLAGLRDALAYNWTSPMSEAEGLSLAARSKTLWLQFRGGNIEVVDSIP